MLDKVIRVRNSSFETRSSKRDDEHIERLLRQIASALNHAAHETEAQRDGLRRRLDSVITRAAVIGGNDIEDLLTRDEADAAILAASDVEIARGIEIENPRGAAFPFYFPGSRAAVSLPDIIGSAF